MELTLDDDQHDELTKLMEATDERGEKIEEITKEADRYRISTIMYNF